MSDHTASHSYGAQRLRQTAERIGDSFTAWYLDERAPSRDLSETIVPIAERLTSTRDALFHALRHSDDASVQRNAARALAGATDHPEVRDALLHDLRHDDDNFVRRMAAEALGGATGHPDVRDALLHALRHDYDVGWRAAFALALGQAADHSVVRDALLHALQHDDNEFVRGGAARSLSGAAEYPNVRDPLLHALQHDDLFVRLSAARSLSGAADHSDVRDAFIHALRHDNYSVREIAAEALGQAADYPDVRNALVHALRHDLFSVQRSAAEALTGAAAAQVGRSPLRVRLLDLRLGTAGPRFSDLLAACRTPDETSRLLTPLHAAGARLMRGHYLQTPADPTRATLPVLWRRVRWRLTARTPHLIRVGVTHIASITWLARLPSPTDENSPLAQS